MLIASDYLILRNLKADDRNHGVALDREPIRIATLINEARFESTGAALIHRDTVFLEDRMHDWEYRDGRLRYYARAAAEADVVVVFAERRIPGLFCGECGKRLHPVRECACPSEPERDDAAV